MQDPATFRGISLPVIIEKGDLPANFTEGLALPATVTVTFQPVETLEVKNPWPSRGMKYRDLPESCQYATLEHLAILVEKGRE